MASTASSSSSSSSPKSVRASQNSTSEKIAKLTLASSLAGAVLTAAYESTRGRARAIREIEAKAATTVGAAGSSGVDGHTSTSTVGSAGTTKLRPDATKFYRHNTALLSASAALNSGLVAFAFFSLREHVVSPALTGARSSYGLGSESGEVGQTLTWSAMRMHHLEDSALTGAFLGGAFNAWKKGPRGIFPGAFTASLACTALQLIVNELDIQRVLYISNAQSTTTITTTTSSPSASQTRTQSPTTPSSDSLSLSLPGNAEPFPLLNAANADTDYEEPKPGLGERFLVLIGITKVDDAEYLRRLKAKRERHLKRISELEALEEARRRASETGVKSDLDSDSDGQNGETK